MTRQERIDLIQATLDEINTIIAETRTATAASTAAENSIETATAPLSELVARMEASFAASRTARESGERTVAAAMRVSALTVALLRRLREDDNDQNEGQQS